MYRPYYQPTSDGPWRDYNPYALTPVVKILLIANVAMFLSQHAFLAVTGISLSNFLGFNASHAIFKLWVWQFVSYTFLHDGPFHIFFNMLLLYFFGRDIERNFGRNRFIGFYLGAGAFAAFCQALLELFNPSVVMIGASGAVMGVMVVYALFYPNRVVFLMLLFPVKVKYFVGALVFLNAFYTVFRTGDVVRVAYMAHLGGAAFGFLFLKFEPEVARAVNRWVRQLRLKEDRRHRSRQRELDRVLRKINLEGVESLTRREKSFLRRASQLFRHSRHDFDVSDSYMSETALADDPDQIDEEIEQELDRILRKISEKGMAMLSEQEKEFLRQTSQRYRQT